MYDESQVEMIAIKNNAIISSTKSSRLILKLKIGAINAKVSS